MPVYRLSASDYDSYDHIEFESDETLAWDEIFERLKAARPAALAEYRRRDAQQWDECEALFGIREWPYSGKFIGRTGTVEQFEAWRDRWSPLLRELPILLEAAGFRVWEPDVALHFERTFGVDDGLVERFGFPRYSRLFLREPEEPNDPPDEES